MSKVLVTGVNGFVGYHVALQLHESGNQIIGVGSQPELQKDLANIVDTYISCDLVDAKAVAKIKLKDIDAIINLAGFAKVGESRGQSKLYNRVNVGVHTVIYQECINQSVSPRIIAVSSGAVYDPYQPLPITEASRLVSDENANEYVVSKKLAEKAVKEFSRQGLNCIIVRPFNHTGPGQLPGFLLPDLVDQIEKAVRNNQSLMVGNLETRRDFTDVRDVARAYIELALCDEKLLKHDTYNICSGVSIAGKEVLRIIIRKLGINKKLDLKVNKNLIRPNDPMEIYGSFDRIKSETGWGPKIPFEQTVADFIEQASLQA